MVSRLFALLLVVMVFGCSQSPSWQSVKEMVHRDFPEVENISTDELKERLASEDASNLVLLDVREEAEFAVSHLPGAVRVDPGSETSEFLDSLDRDIPIIAYCSVGYRSSRLAKRLEERGFTNVKNLEGSIFEWANKGYEVERDGHPVREVHPFDEQWGTLLDEKLHAYEPREER